MNIKRETVFDYAVTCSAQLEAIRDLRSDLLNDMMLFKMYLDQLKQSLPDNERQPIVSLIQDVRGEMDRVSTVNFDDMHYPIYEVETRYSDLNPNKIKRDPAC